MQTYNKLPVGALLWKISAYMIQGFLPFVLVNLLGWLVPTGKTTKIQIISEELSCTMEDGVKLLVTINNLGFSCILI